MDNTIAATIITAGAGIIVAFLKFMPGKGADKKIEENAKRIEFNREKISELEKVGVKVDVLSKEVTSLLDFMRRHEDECERYRTTLNSRLDRAAEITDKKFDKLQDALQVFLGRGR